MSICGTDVFSKLSRLPVSFFDGNTKGNILAILVEDIDNISETVSSDAITLLTGLVTLVGAIWMMLLISPPLTLVFVVTVPIMIVVAGVVKNKARILFRIKKNWFGKLCGYAEEMITAQKTIKVYGIEEYNERKFDEMSESLRVSGSKAEFVSSTMMPQMNFINNLNYIGICAIWSAACGIGRHIDRKYIDVHAVCQEVFCANSGHCQYRQHASGDACSVRPRVQRAERRTRTRSADVAAGGRDIPQAVRDPRRDRV